MIVGERIRRPDAPDKVKGSALYIEDLAFIGALWGAVLRSPHAHARIARLVTSLVPFYQYDEAKIFKADSAPDAVVAQRRADFARLADLTTISWATR